LFEKKLNILKRSLGNYYSSNEEMIFECPKCNHHKKKLSVNIHKNVFKCWICDYRGKDLSALIPSGRLKTEWRELTSTPDLARFEDLFREKEDLKIKHYLELPEHFVSLSEATLSSTGRRAKKYILNRGISEEDILLYKIGFCYHGKYKNRIIIPSYDDCGELNFFVARSFVENQYKYMNPPASKDVVFNDLFVDWEKPITLVEGFFDSVKYENSIPLLGSTLSRKSKLFNKVIHSGTKVYICLDSDAKEKEFRIIKNLLDFGVEVCKIELESYFDLGDVPEIELEDLKKRASVITQQDYLLHRLNIGGQ